MVSYFPDQHQQMNSSTSPSFEIPPDFNRQWGRSDIVILPKGDTNRPLHANKTVLATFSPFFNAMFFGEFMERNQKTFALDIEYGVMKEVLRVIHSVNRNYGQTEHRPYQVSMVTKLYRAGDIFDILMIRKLCKQQLVQIASTEAFEVTIELELHQEKSEILKKMTFADLQAFLGKKGTSLILSANDVAEIVRKTQEYEQNRSWCTSSASTKTESNTGLQDDYDYDDY